MKAEAERKAVVAGQFYTASPEELREQVRRYAERPPVHPDRRAQALVVPHAGYQYSGATAGAGFAEIRGRNDYRRVVVMAPGHRLPFRGASVGAYTGYQTPLGSMAVERETCDQLAASSDWISTQNDAHEGEHALEVELPFLAELLPKATLVPVICGDADLQAIRDIASVLAEQLWDEETLWVVSSDFTHYGHAFGYVPFEDDVPRRLEELDRGAIDVIRRLDAAEFLDYVRSTGATICGRVPIAVLLEAIRAADAPVKSELLQYTNIGKMTGDYNHSVSYAALAFYGETPDASPNRAQGEHDGANGETEELSEADKRYLLRLARQTIEARLQGTKPNVDLESLRAPLKQTRATFVTLHKKGRLRGCIGSLQPSEELVRNVIHNARNAAFQDPRFPELREGELEDVDIEISVLTPAHTIHHVREFEVGRHGIILQKGPHRSVFLPQVAPEQGWDRETTLDYLAMKAGLPENGWRHNATLKVFEAIVFGEDDRR